MLHPHTELRYINDAIGYGVVATKFIPKGTITWVLDELDQLFKQEQVDRMTPIMRQILDKYAYVDGRGRHVLCWDHARFVNHSCNATCLSVGYDFEIAIRDIQPGEELTDDYGGLNIDAQFQCRCDSHRCRGDIRPDDILRLSDEWDRTLREPFRLVKDLTQPLWPFVREKEAVEAALAGLTPIPSSRKNYHPVGQHAAPGRNGAVNA